MPDHRLARPLASLTRTLRWRRRLLASIATAVCLLAILATLSERSHDTVDVVTLAHSVPAGSTLTASDLTVTAVPATLIPEGAITAVPDGAGRLVAAPVPARAILSESTLAVSRGPSSEGGRIVPVRVSEPDIARLVSPGDRITLIAAATPATEAVIARDVLVVTVPQEVSQGWTGASASAALLLVETDEQTAIQVSSVAAAMSVILG